MATVTDSKQARRWCFTWNNYPEDWKIVLDKAKSKYACVGKEVAPETGTKHLQGYMEFTSGKRLVTLKKVSGTIHWTICNGNQEQNIAYCTKEGDSIEWGDKGEQGARSDLLEVQTLIDSGASPLEVATNHFEVYCKFYKGFEKYSYLQQQAEAKKIREVNVEVRWGGTGTGKTHSAIMEAIDSQQDYYITSEGNTGLWWTGYQGEKYVIIDEFRCGVPMHMLLRTLDKYPVQVPIHCGYAHLMATTIIITSNVNPIEWYLGCDEASRQALFRRVNKITHMDTKYKSDAIKNCDTCSEGNNVTSLQILEKIQENKKKWENEEKLLEG